MATSREYIEWVCERLAPYGEVRPRAMFGEYIVELFDDAECGHPYDGAKEHYILDMDDRALLDEVVPLLDEHMPLSKPRKKKG